MNDQRAMRHLDVVKILRLRTPSPEAGAPSLQTFAEEQLRTNFSEPEPDGYILISKENAEDLLKEMDGYVDRWGPLLDDDVRLATELRELLDAWE